MTLLLVVATVVVWSLAIAISPGLALIAIAAVLMALEHAWPHDRSATARGR